MSYIRFENTSADLQDCYNALNNAGSVEEYKKTASQSEKRYLDNLLELCQQIIDDFGGENDEEDNHYNEED